MYQKYITLMIWLKKQLRVINKMVVVVENTQGSAIQNTSGLIGSIIDFFAKSWKFMLVGVIIVVLAIIIWYLLKKMEEERHEREEPGYQLFKSVKGSCRLNCRTELIDKKWSPASLWLLLIPVVGWIIIPFVKSEHSAKLVDYNGKLIGYYRGESKGMDNTLNFLLYKDKYFIFFEDLFVVKVPLKLKFKTKKRKENGVIIKDERGKAILEDKEINLTGMMKTLSNRDIKLYSVSLERVGLYYYCPVFLVDEGDGILDYREIIEGAVIDSTYQVMVQRLLNTASQSMEKGMTLNPHLKYDQMQPEKTKEEDKIDEKA